MKFHQLCHDLMDAEVDYDVAFENVKTGRSMVAAGEQIRPGSLEAEEQNLTAATVKFEAAKKALAQALSEAH